MEVEEKWSSQKRIQETSWGMKDELFCSMHLWGAKKVGIKTTAMYA
jgi:hypothetical protein